MKRLLLAAVLAGLAVFMWSFISWMILPFQNSQLRSFTDESAVASAIAANAPGHGVYLMPGSHGTESGDMEAGMERMKAGPFLYGIVRPGRNDFSFPGLMIRSLLLQIVGAFVLAALLKTARPLPFPGRLLFVIVAATAGAVLTLLPSWIWWEYPGGFIALQIADHIIGWTLGGLVLAGLIRPQTV